MSQEEKGKPHIFRNADQLFNWLAERRRAFPTATGLELYDPCPSDVIVTTFPKAGTTLTQQLCYQIAVATGGASPNDPDGTNFVDICEVAPWVDFMPQMGIRHVLSCPRIFKTHASANMFDIRRQKHVVVLRDPLKFAGSWLDFTFANYSLDVNSVYSWSVKKNIFDETVERDLLGLRGCTLFSSGAFGTQHDDDIESTKGNNNKRRIGAWFEHTKGWVDLMEHDNVLIIFYEDLVKDCATEASRVARFMGRSLTLDNLKMTVKRCSREYMGCDDRFKSILDSKVFGTAKMSSKVRNEKCDGKGFSGMKISEKHLAEYERQMETTFGCASYDELKHIIRCKQ